MTQDAMIVNLFARWWNLEAQKLSLSEDSKELFAEAKSNGFDPKALRLAFRTKIKAEEGQTDADKATKALADTYLAALGTPLAFTRAPREPA